MSEERDELRRIKDYYFCEQISWPELELRIRSYGDERERAGIERAGDYARTLPVWRMCAEEVAREIETLPVPAPVSQEPER